MDRCWNMVSKKISKYFLKDPWISECEELSFEDNDVKDNLPLFEQYKTN